MGCVVVIGLSMATGCVRSSFRRHGSKDAQGSKDVSSLNEGGGGEGGDARVERSHRDLRTSEGDALPQGGDRTEDLGTLSDRGRAHDTTPPLHDTTLLHDMTPPPHDTTPPPHDTAPPPHDTAPPPDQATCLSFEICDGHDDDCDNTIDEGCVAPWWNSAYPYRVRLVVRNNTSAAYVAEPLFVSRNKLAGGATPIKESSLRVFRWDGAARKQVEVPFALHDWTSAGDDLNDADANFDANDQLLLLVDVPAKGSADYYVYYDTKDHTPKGHPKETVVAGGSGFPRVTVDGVTQDAAYLRFFDGAALFDLMLVDSIPYWNESSSFLYESSAIGPRINDLTLPDGTVVYPTVNHTTGVGTGKLVHTIRLGPHRLSGDFSLFSKEQPFFQPRLVTAKSHSAVRARSRPLAAVVIIDAEFYCDEPKVCDPAKDLGDVRLIGYLFDRGSPNEVLMRWRVVAKMNGTGTISATTTNETEFFSLAAYLIESYNETQYASLIDIDTIRVKDVSGAVSSTKLDNTKSDTRTCKDTESWILMSDTEAPYSGVAALMVEGQPDVKGAVDTWRGCWWGDGKGPIELNGYQSEWHLGTSSFASWGSHSNDTTDYTYWIYAYPATASDQTLANARALRIRNPPAITSTSSACKDFPGC